MHCSKPIEYLHAICTFRVVKKILYIVSYINNYLLVFLECRDVFEPKIWSLEAVLVLDFIP